MTANPPVSTQSSNECSPPARPAMESRALRRLSEQVPAAPAWDHLRARLLAGSDQQKEPPMTMLNRLISTKSWTVRLGIALVLVLALTTLSLLLPGKHGLRPADPAWAGTAGYLLTVILAGAPAPDCDNPLVESFNGVVRAWADDVKAAHEQANQGGQELPDVKVKLKIMCRQEKDGTGQTEITVMAAGASVDEMELLKQQLAAVPDLPTPTIEEATWLSDGELDDPDCLGFDLEQGKLFIQVPPGATEEEIQQLVLEWFAQEHPGETPPVIEVEKTESTNADGKKEIKLKIQVEQEPAPEA